MDTITIIRHYYNDHTYGDLYINDKKICQTLELPFNDNKKNISCIPEGTYQAQFHFSAKHKSCFLILRVPDRSEILIHIGNTLRDTRGCILVGRYYSKDAPIITDSKKTMMLLLKSINTKFVIKIINRENNIY